MSTSESSTSDNEAKQSQKIQALKKEMDILKEKVQYYKNISSKRKPEYVHVRHVYVRTEAESESESKSKSKSKLNRFNCRCLSRKK
jgi:parvulin-like peptidyl-prolyl isomerase